MLRLTKRALLLGLFGGIVLCAASLSATAQAQIPVGVTTFYPPQPVVTYYPERRGLLFPRIVYRPAVSYVPATPVPVTTYYVPTTTYMPPVAPVVPVPTPVTTYYAPVPVVPYYLPRVRY